MSEDWERVMARAVYRESRKYVEQTKDDAQDRGKGRSMRVTKEVEGVLFEV